MRPETFRDLLDRATADPPAAPPAYEALGRGRTRLRRRRLAHAAAATAVAVAMGGIAAALPPDRGRERVAEHLTDAQILDRCLGGHTSAEAALVASGPVRVAVSVRTDLRIVSALTSADGALWAECWIWLQPQAGGERGSGIEVYDATVRSRGMSGGWMVGTGCGVPETQDHGCARWAVSAVGKLPSEVASVRLDLGDGTSVTVPTVEGFFVINVLHPVPPGGIVRHDGTIAGFEWGRQVTYLAADGRPLAAARLDSPQDPDVPGIPPLSSLKSWGVPWSAQPGRGPSPQP
jgi:hypothetical protein